MEAIEPAKRLRVAFIASVGHSGSTLTDMMLGAHPSMVSVGEVKHLEAFLRGERKDRCSCGQPLSECRFWSDIAAQGPVSVTPASTAEVFLRVLRRAAAEIVIDSSKSPARLKALLRADGLDLRVIHLVRDGRAVAFSNSRKGRPAREWASRWLEINGTLEAIPRQGLVSSGAWILVRYEDLVRDPEGEIARMTRFLGLQFHPAQLRYASADHHLVGGNRMKKRRDSKIELDMEYLERLDEDEWRVLTEACAEGLDHYGYPFSRHEMLRWQRGRGEEARAAVAPPSAAFSAPAHGGTRR